MNNKKQLILSIGLTLVLVLMIVGISYAAFQFTSNGNKVNTITTGAITMEYTESDNIINMTGALPTTDATGKTRLNAGEYLDFTVKSSITGTANINYEIAAEDVTTSSKKIDGKYIKFYLTSLDDNNNETQVMSPKVYSAKTSSNTKTGRPDGVMSLATGTISSSETAKYRLRMYIDESYNPQGDGGDLSFSVKVNVYGKVKEEPTGSKLKAYMTEEEQVYPETDFHTDNYKNKTTAIVTKSDNTVPETAIESWDTSEKGDGSVMAYSLDDGTGNGTYKITIGGKDGIIANENMFNYFSGFYKLTSIDLSALDTSNVTNMSNMFNGCSIANLDLSNFDTSNVTNMAGMFRGNFINLNVSSFDTSNVTDMNNMFSYCTKLTSLDVSNFNTSKVTNMSAMFAYCASLTTLDVSNFDTSNVTDMSWMFSGAYPRADFTSNLESINLSNFDTSKVTNMKDMFYHCVSLKNLDLTYFDTSNVTDMYGMFDYCLNISSITVSNKWIIGTSTDTSFMFDGCGVDHVTII